MIIVYILYGFIGTVLLAMLLMCAVGAFTHCCCHGPLSPPSVVPISTQHNHQPQQTKEPALPPPPPPMTTITIVVQPDGTVGTVGVA